MLLRHKSTQLQHRMPSGKVQDPKRRAETSCNKGGRRACRYASPTSVFIPSASGLAIAAPAVCLIVLPLVLGANGGWSAWTLGCVAAGLLLAAAFAGFERAVAARGCSFCRTAALCYGRMTCAA
jgi:hypothetical protein